MLFRSIEKHLLITYILLHKIEQNQIEVSDVLLLRSNSIFIQFLRINILNRLHSENKLISLVSYQNILEKLIMFYDYKCIKYPNILFLSKNLKFYVFKKSKNNIVYRKYV